MKLWSPYLLLLFLSLPAVGQEAEELISAVLQRQANLGKAAYTMERTDTLLTGDVRHMRGSVHVMADTSDQLFGFLFWGKRDDVASKVVYTGRVAYETDDSSLTYLLVSKPSQITDLLNHPGGHVLAPDLVRLDTTKASGFSVARDERFHYLTIHYPDLTDYDVRKRCKTVSIDRKTMLPMAVRKHQESLGKVQDLFYRVTSLDVDEAASAYPFAEPEFLSQYTQRVPTRNSPGRIDTLVGKTALAFELPSLDGSVIPSSASLGKVVLLDFWEVWCGPCVASMPQVQQMHENYGGQGLQVFGITHEQKQLDAARRLIERKGVSFPTLVGNASLKEFYGLAAIPLYVVIDQQGKIAFVSEGFSPEIEEQVIKAIGR